MAKNNNGNTYDVTIKKMVVEQYETGITMNQLVEDYDLKDASVYS